MLWLTLPEREAPVILAALIAIALSAAQRPVPYNCQADIRDETGRSVAWVNLGLYEDRQPAHRSLYVRAGNLNAIWDLDGGAPSGPNAMQELSYTVELPPGTSFPIAVSVTGDGRTLWNGTFERSAGSVLHYPAMESFPSIGFVWGRGRAIANVYGIRRLEIAISDGEGRALPTVRAPLPDWDWLGGRIRVALDAVERQRLAGRCGPSAIA